MSMKNSNDTIGNRTRDPPACGAVPQPTAPTRAWEGVPVPICIDLGGFQNRSGLLEKR